jgi:hypothetical protein
MKQLDHVADRRRIKLCQPGEEISIQG